MSNRNPYVDSIGQKRMLESVVVFADILGYRKITENAYQQGNEMGLLNQLCVAVESTHRYLYDNYDYLGKPCADWQFKSFSDHIVIGFPIEHCDQGAPMKNWGEAELGQVLDMLSVFQLTMVEHGFFIRGGISLGKVYMDSQIVYGDAFIRAYEVESRRAIYPRILLDSSPRLSGPANRSYWWQTYVSDERDIASTEWRDPSMTKLVQFHSNFYGPGFRSANSRLLLKDCDNQIFLNYLQVLVSENLQEGPNQMDFVLLKKHRDLVVAGLSNTASEPSIQPKYVWAARYHNYFCDQNRHLYDTTAYKVDDELLGPSALEQGEESPQPTLGT